MSTSTPPPQRPDTAPVTARLPFVELRVGRLLGIFLTVLAAAGVAWLAWQLLGLLAHILALIAIAGLFALILAPVVERLSRRGTPRILAVLLPFLLLIALLAGGIALLAGPLTSQASGLVDRLPEQLASMQGLEARLDDWLARRNIPVRAEQLRAELVASMQQAGVSILGGLPYIALHAAELLINIVAVLFLTFYMLLDGRRLHDALMRLTPAAWRGAAFVVEAAVIKTVSGYLRGQLLVALMIGVSAGLGCWILGIPYAAVIGVVAGVLELVPMLGPILGAIVAVIITLPQGPTEVIKVALLFLVVHQVELNILGPRIAGHAVGLHPVAALLALLLGLDLFGPAGALIGVPVAGLVWVLASAIYYEARGQSTPARTVSPATSLPHLLQRLARRSARRVVVGEQVTGAEGGTVATVVTVTTDADRPASLQALEEQVAVLQAGFHEREQAREAEIRAEERAAVQDAPPPDAAAPAPEGPPPKPAQG